jgi:hypothetical protein
MADGSVDFRSPCLSGCGMECDFCGVGQDKFFTVLSAQQILSIMEISLQAAKVPVDAKLQVQFFSTGEPMLSVKPIFEAIRQIYQANNNRLNEIVISTSAPQAKYESANNRGEYSHLIALGEEIPVLFLQLSIQINDETRNARIHRPNKLTLDQMSEIGATFHERTNRKPIVNLVADPDHSSHEELSNVVRIFPPTHFNVKVSTLSGETKTGAITPGEAKALDMLQEGHQTDFSNTLGAARFFKSQGYERVLIFDPLGRDEKNMQSGCGDFPDAGEAHSRLAEGRRKS